MQQGKLFGVINFLPEYAQEYVQWLLTGLVVLIIFNLIIKQLRTPGMKSAWRAAKAVGDTLKSFSLEFSKTLELPVKYPRVELFVHALFVINNYLAALYFFAFFVLVSVLTVVADAMTSWQRLAGVAFSIIALIFARFCFAEAERGRIAFPILYAKCRRHS
ncbi:MAG: hypothetical protein HOO97_07630 [Sideroxydans sp.]|nr:hypothetical protein [Sideroxydans sp.]